MGRPFAGGVRGRSGATAPAQRLEYVDPRTLAMTGTNERAATEDIGASERHAVNYTTVMDLVNIG